MWGRRQATSPLSLEEWDPWPWPCWWRTPSRQPRMFCCIPQRGSEWLLHPNGPTKNATATHSSATLNIFYFLLGATWYAPLSSPCTRTGKMIALRLSSCWHLLTPPKFYAQPSSDCYILLLQRCVQCNRTVSIYHLHCISVGFYGIYRLYYLLLQSNLFETWSQCCKFTLSW